MTSLCRNEFDILGFKITLSKCMYALGTSVGTSELRYTPASARDYGTLSCRGSNSIGRQLEPCLFQLIPAG